MTNIRSEDEAAFLKALGKRLRGARERNELSRETVSGRIGRSKDTIEDWENGLSTPTVYALSKAAHLYEVSMDWLIGNDDAPKPEHVAFIRSWGAASNGAREVAIKALQLETQQHEYLKSQPKMVAEPERPPYQAEQE